MNSRPMIFWWLLLTIAMVALTLFGGCRAFEPEAVIVNRPPETFLVGAPIEGGGGYYHYHMFWYGSDEDGVVERFVWALTDTSVQNDDTTDDEEDARFNPALDISHLEIGQWTTRTDSIFDFQINQGTSPSVDMTFHMVAVDDFGDFDRTPARLHFFSNTLGTPEISFFRIDGTDTIPLAFGVADTVGYGKQYTLHWRGSSPNVLGYDLNALALVDTVPPYNDGLFGYKWQLGGALGGNCNPSLEDCWHPRRFNEATGDSFSYFGGVNSLTFQNSVPGDSDPFLQLLESGTVNVRVNSLDVAGVEVERFLREFQLMVNYDPETILLRGETDWAHPEDPEVYPYYVRLNDPDRTKYPFNEGERIPDRSYVVFKALARDNQADNVVDPDFKIGLTGLASGVRENYTGGPFSFQSGASNVDFDPTWDANDEGWYADTLGFLVGPRTEFTFRMQAVDEHGRRDGTPPTFSFDVGYPPCLQCIELLPDVGGSSAFTPDLECYEVGDESHPCFQDTAVYHVKADSWPALPGNTYLSPQPALGYLAISKNSALTAQFVQEEPDDNFYSFPVRVYSFTILLHGQDDPREAYANPLWRSMAWRYQVNYDCDPGNSILDGGGVDDIFTPTWGYESGTPNIVVNPSDGLWDLKVDVYVPTLLLQVGNETFRIITAATQTGNDMELANRLCDISMRQFSAGSVQALTLDQPKSVLQPIRPSRYHLFDDVRPPNYELQPGQTWRDYEPSFPEVITSLRLDRAAMDNAVYDAEGNLLPATRPFKIIFQDVDTSYFTCTLTDD